MPLRGTYTAGKKMAGNHPRTQILQMSTNLHFQATGQRRRDLRRGPAELLGVRGRPLRDDPQAADPSQE